ncbi:hypothetical protein GCM10022251_04450 [Phytohabitans flavus]|uniref:Uncharacterized protein n=1 Tax=Phytohabitans flavus TaxID=1076124 RepID=A0A6F8Y2W8_9ACTN|nr:G1 family glutamic endopeptidase [Phytohabitans flavus]BCB80397.1 hypothetical protein Pflav_068070 [Phytohabitans flavus]
MTEQLAREKVGVRRCPAPPKGFDPFTASQNDLIHYGLPLRPDPRTQPGMAALWERQANLVRDFEHLEAEFDATTADKQPVAASALAPAPIESCGYNLTSLSAPFSALFVNFTVPNLRFAASPLGINRFHTFAGLGFLDVHVEMTVDSAQNVTAQLWALGVGNVNLPVAPGEVIAASLCLDTNGAGTATYFLTNQTRGQTMSFSVNTGFPPAVTINAGVTRGDLNQPVHPLARFGTVYFDEISAFTTSGTRSLTAGDAITMTETTGATLARPIRINEFAFKAVFAAS